MQILEGDLLRKMNSSRTKREIKGRKKECEQEEKEREQEEKEREIKGRKKEREQEETCPEMSSVCKHPKPSACIK